MAGGASKYLSNLPSRGLLSATVLSSNPGGMRVYVCDHETSPPEEQLIKTNTTNILIRALEMNKQKSEAAKAVTEGNKGKRPAVRTRSRTPAKRANTASASGSTEQERPSTGFSEKILQTMTVERLRALLKQRGLSQKGRKDELIERLKG